MNRILSLLVAAPLFVAAPHAHAQPKPSDGVELDEARQRFQRGVDLYREGSFDAAFAEFTKAYELAPNYRVLYNMAQVQNERHDYVAAIRLFEKYLAEGGGDVPADRKEQVARDLTALRGRVAELTVESNVEGAELLVDGIAVGVLPLPQPVLVSAGVRQLQLRKAGYETATRSQTVAGGDPVRVAFELAPQAGAAPLAGAPRDAALSTEAVAPDMTADGPPEERSKAPMWITLAATGVFAGGAVTFGVLTGKSNDALDAELERYPADPDRVADARSELKRNALLTDGLTAAAVVTGGFFLYFAISGASSPSDSSADTVSVGVAPTVGGARVLGHF